MDINYKLQINELIIHPGETLKEVLKNKKIALNELSIKTGYSVKYISKIIKGKKDISNKFASSLEYSTKIPSSFWINLQNIYNKEVKENIVFGEHDL